MVEDELFHHLEATEGEPLVGAGADGPGQVHGDDVQVADALAVRHAEDGVHGHVVDARRRVPGLGQQLREQSFDAARDLRGRDALRRQLDEEDADELGGRAVDAEDLVPQGPMQEQDRGACHFVRRGLRVGWLQVGQLFLELGQALLLVRELLGVELFHLLKNISSRVEILSEHSE